MRRHYLALKRKIVLIMAAAAITPLLILATINYFEFQSSFLREAQTPLRSMLSKTKNSFELFLAERSSTLSLIASLYTYEELSNPTTLNRIFWAMQKDFSGFADLALVGDDGKLVTYVGPYEKALVGVDYSGQEWFQKVLMRNRFISGVFTGFRHFPHVVVAVRHTTQDGQAWIVRATLDTTQFTKLITAMNLEPGSDAFLLDRNGILQTDSLRYGNVLDSLGFSLPAPSYDTNVMELRDSLGQNVLASTAVIADTDFVLVAIKPTTSFLSNWLLIRTDLLLVFIFSALGIYFVAARNVEQLIERVRKSDEEREQMLLQMEHTQKLSSIGRLAAGVAHEINNPLAVINEKAGLLQDILALESDFPKKEMFGTHLAAIPASVKRCRDITQRMLGFARRMDVKIETLNVNEMVRETLTFLAKEALHRNVRIEEQLDNTLPGIDCDRGQLQQVFLNILTNALAAVKEDGLTIIRSSLRDDGMVAISFQDNGAGMTEETKKHIFEPFYTTKGENGTGLGMSIIYGIVKRHGGSIEVESELGRGTTVTIILPVRQAVAGA